VGSEYRGRSKEYRARLKPAKLIRGSDVTGRTDATQSRPYPRQSERGTGDRDVGKRPESSLNYLSAKH